MKPFGIKAQVKKLTGTAARVYLRSEVDAAAARYVPQKRNPVTIQQKQEVTGFSKRNPEAEVTLLKEDNPLKSHEGYEVTLSAHMERPNDDAFNPDYWK